MQVPSRLIVFPDENHWIHERRRQSLVLCGDFRVARALAQEPLLNGEAIPDAVVVWMGRDARRGLRRHPAQGVVLPDARCARQRTCALDEDGATLGFAREVPDPENVWLLLHGNGGQAADRTYALPAFSERDSVYIMEYPGYGERSGKPSRHAFDDAARQAYAALRARFTDTPVCVAAESIGSGPASMLAAGIAAARSHRADRAVRRPEVRRARSRQQLPVGMLLAGTWDNGAALTGYGGPLEIFGAERDEVIPVRHAQALASRVPQARFHLIRGGHNEWSLNANVRIRNAAVSLQGVPREHQGEIVGRHAHHLLALQSVRGGDPRDFLELAQTPFGIAPLQ